MVDKIKISYPLLTGYFIFVFVSSLLLGLFLPFVNRPKCDPKTPKYNNDVSQIASNQPKIRLPLPQRIENFKRNFTGKYSTNNPYLKNNLRILEELPPICEEIQFPDFTKPYPWKNIRLPKDIEPINYDIEVFIPEWGVPIYDGFLDIQLNVLKATDLIMVHAKIEIPFLNDLLDKDGNRIKIKCIGEYPQNDYFIVKLEEPITPQKAPLTLGFIFIGFFDVYDEGIFEFGYGDSGQ
jgi:hypothetical protein